MTPFPFRLPEQAAGFPHVMLPQAPSPTSAIGQVSLTLDLNGNVTAVTAVVQVN